ncbi:MAG: ABC transporter substrate-binding protein [Alphaproteobacteria bacterium]|nr:ABC transporter substrate-binding protein [Alphaproteobacteria bacterium]
MRRSVLALLLLLPFAARAAELVDATGRHVAVPAHVTRVLPAGPPAAVLLEALAPDLMIGWPNKPSAQTAAWLPPAVAALPAAPPVDPDRPDLLKAAKPDLIVDYGDVDPRYTARAEQVQERSGIPMVLLDGALERTPAVLRALGAALDRSARAEELARLVEQVLAPTAAATPRTVVYARSPDGLTVVAPGALAAEVFAALHWKVLAPDGKGHFRHTGVQEIAALDPDVLVFAGPAMRETVAASPDWRALRAVREHHALIAPGQPFGWIEHPASLNRVLGVLWLRGDDPAALAQKLYPELYGRAPDPAQLDALRATTQPIAP